MRRTVHPLARRLASRLAARRRLGREGRLDVRRTVRASLGTGGVPVETHHRPRRLHKPELVVLCDVSGSVAGFAHFTLMLTAALREQFSRVRAFAFIDTCDEVTRLFGPGADLADSVRRLAREADLVGTTGTATTATRCACSSTGSRMRSGRRPRCWCSATPAPTTGIPGSPCSRGWSTESRHAYWLNPEPRREWDSGDSMARRYGDVIEMVECRNVAQLTDFVGRLLPV